MPRDSGKKSYPFKLSASFGVKLIIVNSCKFSIFLEVNLQSQEADGRNLWRFLGNSVGLGLCFLFRPRQWTQCLSHPPVEGLTLHHFPWTMLNWMNRRQNGWTRLHDACFKYVRCNPDVAPRLTSGGYEYKVDAITPINILLHIVHRGWQMLIHYEDKIDVNYYPNQHIVHRGWIFLIKLMLLPQSTYCS